MRAQTEEKESHTSKKRKAVKQRKRKCAKKPRNSKSRTRYSNSKKFALVREFEKLKIDHPKKYKEMFTYGHPSISLNTVKNWCSHGVRPQLEQDALHASPAVRNAKVSSKRLDFLNQGEYPDQENTLYNMYKERRDKYLKVLWFGFKVKWRKFWAKSSLRKVNFRSKNRRFVTSVDSCGYHTKTVSKLCPQLTAHVTSKRRLIKAFL